MTGTVSPTDYGWFEFLATRDLQEVNFWTPSARRAFHAEPFSPFFFKLKAPHNAVCGFAFFAKWSRLPDWMAWECFGAGNGCETLESMQQRIRGLRRRMRYVEQHGPDMIGCILLVGPTFFSREAWIPQPANWPVRSLTPVRYDLTRGEGKRLWDACRERGQGTLGLNIDSQRGPAVVREAAPRYGAPVLMQPRLGQGTFRVAVTDAYSRACAVTGEHSLPALEAAHIRPYADAGPHEVRNGLLLRSDLHRLFDKGYLTVTPDCQILVSPRLRTDYENGRTYYPYNHRQLQVTPHVVTERPAAEFLLWHNEHRFLG